MWVSGLPVKLAFYITRAVERFKSLMRNGKLVVRYELANIHSLNFYIVGILGEGVASSVRTDPQARPGNTASKDVSTCCANTQ